MRTYNERQRELLRLLKQLLNQGDAFRFRQQDLVPKDHTALPSPRGTQELIYLTAILVALADLRSQWTKRITGAPGRPVNVEPYFIFGTGQELNATIGTPYAKHSFRAWLSRDLGVDRGDYLHDHEPRWRYSGDARYTVSLFEQVGNEPTGDDGDGSPITLADTIPDQSATSIDPAQVAMVRHPDWRVVYDLFPWSPSSRSPQPARPLKDADAAHRVARSREGLRPSSAPATVIDARGKRIKWTTANPAPKAQELRELRNGIRQVTCGRYSYFEKEWGQYTGNGHPENIAFVARWRLARTIVGVSDPAWFIYVLEREVPDLSATAIDAIRAAVRAENVPVLDKLDEVMKLIVSLTGHPVAEAERILRLVPDEGFTEAKQRLAA